MGSLNWQCSVYCCL